MKLPWPFRSRERRNRELEEEIAAHLREAQQDRIALGESPEEAAANARREFGSQALVSEETREAWGGLWLERLVQDLGFGFRMLRRSPGFSLLAMLCLTVGIGGSAAVFSWIEGVLLRPFPLVADQGRILAVTGTIRGAPAPGLAEMSWPDFRDLKSCPRIESVIAEKITGTTLNYGDRAERVPGSVVSSNYFEALGVRPILGRGFEPSEDSGRNAHPVTVISYQAWKERFGGDTAILGKTQVLNGLPHTIVGVAPEGFYGTFVGYAFQFWVPLSMQPQHIDNGEDHLEDRGARWIEGFVRVKPGVTRRQAQEEVSALSAGLEKGYPATNRGRGVRLFPLWQTPFNNAGALLPTLAVALVVVISVLLIACANVGNLLLVRAFARRKEMTVRVAIGAGRGRLVRQLLTEGLILSIVSAAAGVGVARALRDALVLLIPVRGVPLRVAGTLDWRVIALCAGVCLVTTVLFALAPAILASRIDVAGVLREETQAGGLGGPRGKFRVRSAFVLVQMSLSFVLLVGAGLVLRSLNGVRSASPGFSAEGLLTTSVNLFTAGYDKPRAKNFQEALIERVRTIPGVESAALSRVTPFSYRTYSSAPIAVEGYVPPPDQQPSAEYNEIGPGFLATLKIPLLAGREFTRADDEAAPPVAVVDETMAARYWPGKDPLGRVLLVKGQPRRIVGVAKAAAYSQLLETPAPFFYVPLRQNFSPSTGLQIRTKLSPGALAPILAREIHSLDANVSPYQVITMREQLDAKSSPQRVAATILSVFGALALGLAAVGLYGVMASVVSQSARELAIRTALGARTADLIRLVLSHGLSLTAMGVALGAAAALVLTRLLGYLLYKVGPRDPGAFGTALLVMAAASLAACLIPAWRVVRADPARALRA
ncbi:MAG TPA: ABC transporter permease [Thermoanaerobaculia bacterium]|nr:ABC transporter permease [Thermoanaerobaculia bacterium]